MLRRVPLLTIWVSLTALVPGSVGRAAEPQAPVRSILVRPERVTPEFLAVW